MSTEFQFAIAQSFLYLSSVYNVFKSMTIGPLIKEYSGRQFSLLPAPITPLSGDQVPAADATPSILADPPHQAPAPQSALSSTEGSSSVAKKLANCPACLKIFVKAMRYNCSDRPMRVLRHLVVNLRSK